MNQQIKKKEMNQFFNYKNLALATSNPTGPPLASSSSSLAQNLNNIQQQPAQNVQTTDALIINSNSSIVSDEILMQLQEQFGDSKQIYILNSLNNSVSSLNNSNNNSNQSTSINASNLSLNNSNQTPTIQYLVVDKDVDINALLDDPNLLQHTNANNMNTTVSNSTPPSTGRNNSLLSNTSSNSIEESIQRVQAPPPKRKKIEYKLDPNKKMTYQDAFLRFLAGEKQPTLEMSHTSATNPSSSSAMSSSITLSNTNEVNSLKKPSKDTVFCNYYSKMIQYAPNANQPVTSAASSSTNININVENNSNIQPLTVNTDNNPNTTGNVNIVINDKENYYNSSRRENLASNEFRNSYKDHFDTQGVRVNPAIFKSLPQQPQISSTSSTSTIQISVPPVQHSNHHIHHHQIVVPSHSVTSAKPQIINNKKMVNNGSVAINIAKTNIFNDHTYKVVTNNNHKQHLNPSSVVQNSQIIINQNNNNNNNNKSKLLSHHIIVNDTKNLPVIPPQQPIIHHTSSHVISNHNSSNNSSVLPPKTAAAPPSTTIQSQSVQQNVEQPETIIIIDDDTPAEIKQVKLKLT
jgi:hypothetical protein